MRPIRLSKRITNKEVDSFKQYLNDITKFDLLTIEEEEEYALLAQKGDQKSIDTLVERNLRFVVSIAKQYETATTPLQDLINEGSIGLILAAQKFDVTKGYKFITYAVFWVRKMIMEFLDKNDRLVRVPANKLGHLSKLNQYINKMEQDEGRNVDVYEVMDEFGIDMSKEEILQIQNISSFSFESLDNPLGNSENSSDHYDFIPNESTKPSDHLIVYADLKLEISNILNTLKPRDREIMIALYGLDGSSPISLMDLSEKVGLTREMVRQIRVKCLKQLKLAYNK